MQTSFSYFITFENAIRVSGSKFLVRRKNRCRIMILMNGYNYVLARPSWCICVGGGQCHLQVGGIRYCILSKCKITDVLTPKKNNNNRRTFAHHF